MTSASHRSSGFTLIELMVTLAVILILAMLALPSFNSFQQRSALRGSAEQVMSLWNQARFEAAKRNQMVKFGIKTSGSNFCVGLATTTTTNDTTPCDCFTANACDVAGFPAPPATSFDTQSEWRNVTFITASGTTPTLGGTNNSVAVIEPKRTFLAATGEAGVLSFKGPSGSKSYRLNMIVNDFGKAVLCESKLTVDKMSDYEARRCDP
jgi:prepilin-type N-terminal cleavage/methylation domain-containing protein